ncbi:MAG: thioredoxin domain-containing protein [Desulfurivibrionaceae bacterium]|nr:thioredoxin domain-containing protein [Desulfurivibrionaceae bacterium]
MSATGHTSTTTAFVKEQLAAGKEANPLIDEKSPYLLQHAFNPVQWLPWGDEAFQRARQQDKPIFLSIGYSTCHWCHVMAHESFEDEEVAAFLNAHYIAIKVDREERPDIDQLYMTATQAITGGGGWPLSVFLLPDRRPFYAGTYFPPRSAHGRPGFLDLLRQIHLLWQKERSRVTGHAEEITATLRSTAAAPAQTEPLSEELLHRCLQQAAQSFDSEFGGFGNAPKFPRPALFDFLLRYQARHKNEQAREMVLFSLKKMAEGGIYDQLGGGFHRYSVDRQWQVPHFEKMLSDQGQLASLYFEAFQVSHHPFFRAIGSEILDYVLRDMTDPQGGFYSAEDADSASAQESSRHGEGLFYLWSEAEIIDLLGETSAAICNFFFGVQQQGNVEADPLGEFSGQNILAVKRDLAATARTFGKTEEEVEKILDRAKARLFRARQQRPRPHLDDKIITAWNGLMISAMAKGFKVTGQKRYLQGARASATFLEKNLLAGDDHSLFRRYREGEAHFQGQLDDYAFFVQGLLDLYGADFNGHWLELALAISRRQKELFFDEKEGVFFDSPLDAENILVRMRNEYDGAEPSGNAVAAMNLLRLTRITANREQQQEAAAILSFFAPGLMEQPFGRPALAAAYDLYSQNPSQIILAGNPEAADTKEMLALINSLYLPTTLLLLADNGPGQRLLEQQLPFMKEMTALDNRATAYLCQDFSCKKPVQSVAELAALLPASAPWSGA